MCYESVYLQCPTIKPTVCNISMKVAWSGMSLISKSFFDYYDNAKIHSNAIVSYLMNSSPDYVNLFYVYV